MESKKIKLDNPDASDLTELCIKYINNPTMELTMNDFCSLNEYMANYLDSSIHIQNKANVHDIFMYNHEKPSMIKFEGDGCIITMRFLEKFIFANIVTSKFERLDFQIDQWNMDLFEAIKNKNTEFICNKVKFVAFYEYLNHVIHFLKDVVFDPKIILLFSKICEMFDSATTSDGKKCDRYNDDDFGLLYTSREFCYLYDLKINGCEYLNTMKMMSYYA